MPTKLRSRLLATFFLLVLQLSASATLFAAESAGGAGGTDDGRIVVGIHPSPPFVIPTATGSWSGLSIDLWRLIAEQAGVAYRFEEMELEHLFTALNEGRINLAVGALSMTPDREKNIDFSHPYLISGLGIAVRGESSKGLGAALSGLVSPQLLRLLLVVAAWLLISGALVWFFERKRNPTMFGGTSMAGIGSGFWWALVTLTTVGYGDKAPITKGGRTVAMVWMLASLVVLSSLTAAITTSLTVTKLQSTVNGPNDLFGKRVATVRGSASAEWLSHRGIAFDAHKELDKALDALEQDRADAVVYDAPILNYAIQQRNSSDVRLLEQKFQLHFSAFALPPGSPKLEVLNYAILNVVRGDQWQQMRSEYLGDSH